MELRLPIPIFYKDQIYKEVEIEAPDLKILIGVKKIADRIGGFSCVLELCKRCTVSISGINDRGLISTILKYVPYRSAELMVHRISQLYKADKEEGIEGIYKCPLCKREVRAELGENFDTRDFLSKLKVNYMEKEINFLTVDFEKPVIINVKDSFNDKNTIEINSIGLRVPTLEDCIAYESYADEELNLAVYSHCITHINGIEQDKKDLNYYRDMILYKINNEATTQNLHDAIYRYGLETTFEKVCRCGRRFRVTPSTANFFDQALQDL